PQEARENQGYGEEDADNERRLGMKLVEEDEQALAEPKGEQAPKRHPQRRADGVEHEKAQPVHLQRAGDDAVELAQDDDEAGEEHDDIAVAVEEVLDLRHPLLGDAHPAAIAHHQMVAAGPPDDIADIVADDRADPGEQQQQPDVERAARGEDGAGDEQRLARRRHAEILEQDAERHGEIAVIAYVALDLAEEGGEHAPAD